MVWGRPPHPLCRVIRRLRGGPVGQGSGHCTLLLQMGRWLRPFIQMELFSVLPAFLLGLGTLQGESC